MTIETLSKSEHEAVTDFVNNLAVKFGSFVTSVILFGSKARGDYDQESDIDLVVLLNRKNAKIHRDIVGLACESGLKCGRYLSVKVFLLSRFQELVAEGDPFAENVAREGKVVWK